MGEDAKKVIINLGCGHVKLIGGINVDLYGNPDVRWDLEKTPLPFDDESADYIHMNHVLEHVKNWWPLFKDCSRVLKTGCDLQINVPDESSSTALTYRDHVNVFSIFSFSGCMPGYTTHRAGTNAWASEHEVCIPLTCYEYRQVPYANYRWMMHWPLNHLLHFMSKHMRNFIWEQRFTFRKVDKDTFLKYLKDSGRI
jgi:ubiquinone/menaquinone biosynthesis C-methylase UbiE